MAKKAYVRNSDNTEWVELASATTDLDQYLLQSSASSTYITQNSASTTYAPIVPAVQTGFRNILVNGDMRVKQRSAFTTTTNSHQFTTDRWWAFSGTSTVGSPSYVTSTTLNNFPNALRAQRQASNTGIAGIAIGQTIESTDVNQIRGRTVTLSFWARAGANFSSASSQIGVFISEGTGIDQGTPALITQTWTGFSNTLIGTGTLSSSWQKFTYSYTVLSTTTEMAVQIFYNGVGTAGTNDYFDITGVQLELGNIATPFEYRPFGTELLLCQRHYFVSGNQYGPATNFGLPHSYHGPVYFPTTMRTVPNISIFSASGSANLANWYPGNIEAAPHVESQTTGTFILLRLNTSTYSGVVYSFIASAEL
jgi:hypothetical protein